MYVRIYIHTHTHTYISAHQGEDFQLDFLGMHGTTLVRVPPTFVTRIPSSLKFPNVKPPCQIQTSNVILLELSY